MSRINLRKALSLYLMCAFYINSMSLSWIAAQYPYIIVKSEEEREEMQYIIECMRSIVLIIQGLYYNDI